jgi:hypothetical protein
MTAGLAHAHRDESAVIAELLLPALLVDGINQEGRYA